jgi:hypothetical protein
LSIDSFWCGPVVALKWYINDAHMVLTVDDLPFRDLSAILNSILKS